MELVRGEVLDAELLRRAVAGADVVLCALGLRRNGRSPWAALLSPPNLMERVAECLISAMRRERLSRAVVISAGGVGDSVAQLSAPVRRLVRQGQIAVAYQDLERMEGVLAQSGLDTLAVRPVTLIDGPPRRNRVRPVLRYGLTSAIRRSEVADWMLCAAGRSGTFPERSVLIAA